MKAGPIKGPFVVSDFFTPSGFMGDGAVPGRLTVSINENCKQPRPPGAQGDCYHFTYSPRDKDGYVHWAGAYWVYPSNSWGTVPGRTVVPPIDLMQQFPPGTPTAGQEMRRYTHVRFYAAVGPLTMNPLVSFYAGGIDGRTAMPPQPYFDWGCQFFPNTDPFCLDVNNDPFPFKQQGGDTLTTEWKQYEIDLSHWALSSVIGAFGWAANDNSNPNETHHIYFDDIVWE